ncbi:MAG: prepilin-type N-terminal cleavage/methylation domain-containing protein, partial [Candidatus Thiodiazotropha sp. (ex Lucinoma borealis)]|nr:prepilin-type N-terminal cleavage/methylation domain-containing protein [Candidatus Thiodiazotropha sp. (ex Lucinoma borealis)]
MRAIKLAQQGFTLVELLIVVIILALLAAIIVPQFASSTEDAKISSLDTSLAVVRTVLDLYHQ